MTSSNVKSLELTRFFVFDPAQRYLYIANQDSRSIVGYRVGRDGLEAAEIERSAGREPRRVLQQVVQHAEGLAFQRDDVAVDRELAGPLIEHGAHATEGLTDEDDLDGRLAVGQTALDPGDVGAPADELDVGRGPMRMARGKDDDRLDEAGLTGGVGSPDELWTGSERRDEAAVSPEVREPE